METGSSPDLSAASSPPVEVAATDLPPVAFLDLFRFASGRDRAYAVVGCFAAVVHGALLPLWTIVFANVIEELRFQLEAAARTGIRIRKLYLRSLMRQEFAWYDTENSGELLSHVVSDADRIQSGIGDKLVLAVQFIAQGVVGIAVSFFYSWRITLVVLTVVPLIAACGAVPGRVSANMMYNGQGAYSRADAILCAYSPCFRRPRRGSGTV